GARRWTERPKSDGPSSAKRLVPSARWLIRTILVPKRRVPAVGDHRGAFRRAPRAGVVAGERKAGAAVSHDRIDDPPRGLDGILAREEHLVAPHRVPKEPLVRRLFPRGLVARIEQHRLARHRVARLLRPRAELEHHVGTEPE